MARKSAFREVSPEVLVGEGNIVLVSAADREALVERAKRGRLGRARILFHPGSEDPLHEMLIVCSMGDYVQPHANLKTSKSYHLLEGRMLVVFFTDGGDVEEHLILEGPPSDENNSARIAGHRINTVIALTPTVTFLEIVPGPWEGTPFVDWAPDPAVVEEAHSYFADLLRTLERKVEGVSADTWARIHASIGSHRL